MTKATLTFFSGLNSIGGVNILFGSGNSGIIFDFGISLQSIFSESVRPRQRAGIRDYLLTRTAPPVLSLYDQDQIRSIRDRDLEKIWNRSFPKYERMNVFVSHIHQDHMALLPYLNSHIPVYMHHDAHSVLKAVAASGEYPKTDALIRGMADLETIDFGDFSLQVLEVDHDTPGTSGFILRTKEHSIAFTADWRMHGRHSDRMQRFVERCSEAKVDVLITEGTRLRPEQLFNKPIDRYEVDVAKKYREVMEQNPGLVYINILARNVERVADIVLATKAAGRTLVMDEMTAALWFVAIQNGIRSLEGNPATDDRETIRVLETQEPNAVDPELLLPYETVKMEEVIANKSAYSVYLTYQNLPLMSELETLGDTSVSSHYVHADGNPLTNTDPTLHKWLTHFNVVYHYHATGGHAAPHQISDLIEGIRPKVVIPLHSMHPSLCDSRGIARFYPNYGETVDIDQLVGIKSSVIL